MPALSVATLTPQGSIGRVGAAFVVSLALGGCVGSSGDQAPTVVASAPAGLQREKLVGRWGVASFREAKDRERTEVQARAQCKLPYVIALGPTDGVMMHAADDSKLYELKLKSGGGKTYLGFDAPAGDSQDREVLQASDNVLVMRFVDPDVNTRYGTMVYVRCRA